MVKKTSDKKIDNIVKPAKPKSTNDKPVKGNNKIVKTVKKDKVTKAPEKPLPKKIREIKINNKKRMSYYAPPRLGTKYKGKIIEGMDFPDQPVRNDLSIHINSTIINKIIPILNELDYNYNLKLLAILMAKIEGFKNGSRSYRTNNPGNIGNVDAGGNHYFPTLKDGVEAQLKYFERIINNEHTAYLYKHHEISPYYSPEIAKYPKVYVISPYLPGYSFDFKGELAGFVKIYATTARGSNIYLSYIVSWFKQNGIEIDEHTTLNELLSI